MVKLDGYASQNANNDFWAMIMSYYCNNVQ